jgi:hypothetical protein
MRSRSDLTDTSHPLEALWFLTRPGRGFGRLRMLAGGAVASRVFVQGARADCEVGADLPAEVAGPD